MHPDQSLIVASPNVQQLLRRLHTLSEAEEKSFSQRFFYLTRLVRFFLYGEIWSTAAEDYVRDKFIALDSEKCRFIYLLARSAGACDVIEAGTSFGVSTIYLALAVSQNVRQREIYGGRSTSAGKVLATEKEPAKAAKARANWKEAGPDVEKCIELSEGDILGTLRIDEGIPEKIDLLLPDIWTPLALPTLKLVQPRLKHGAIVIADNVGIAKFLYKDFLEYIRNPENGFRSLMLPFSGGLELAVYLPRE
ncbi:hypothetical protein AA0111_g11916 [Alternaria arborescens]|uniref:hypothetical protein n=1 Tax=Alternaria arborescens TaxID=156630 RepID=UPI001074AC52|nr:hypothetical protein AA0111_g11916 [Alternaria arborescens]RYO14571.1 hypothetical protein AA0111_g11916 [Alternaria arborescens]